MRPILAFALLAAACSSTEDSSGGIPDIELNKAIEGSVTPAASATWALQTPVPIHFVVLVQVISGDVSLDLQNADGTPVYTLKHIPPGTFLSPHETAGVTTTAGAKYTLVFSGTGQFRFEVYNGAPSPEHTPALLSIGDSVTTERLDFPGDIDDFIVTVTTRDTIQLLINTPTPTHLRADFFTPGNEPSAAATAYESASFAVEPGQYVFRVSDPGGVSFPTYTGPYTAVLARIRSAPENAPGTIAIGDTVTESLDPSGDVDIFSFPGNWGDHLEIQVQGRSPGAPTDSHLAYQLTRPRNKLILQGSFPTVSAALSDRRSGRITLPETGIYRITIATVWQVPNPPGRGPYRMALVRLSGVPETHAPVIALGETITTETLNGPDDIDEFTLNAPPGTELKIFLGPGTPGATILAEGFVPTTGDTVFRMQSLGLKESSPNLVMPAGGTLLIRVTSTDGATAPYQLQVFPLNRAPEIASATYALGDTVSGERIDPPGDIDEYHFTGTAGQKVVAYLQTQPGLSFPGITLEIIVPGTGEILTSVESLSPTSNLNDRASPIAVFPVSGTYLIRVRSRFELFIVGDYRFAVQILP